MISDGRDFRSLRQWDGSQYRAFEELCYQLRDPMPEGGELVKTGNPDGGFEWYVNFKNGVQWGWQAKFTFEIDTLLKLMEKSLKTVVEKRPKCRRLTFCIPFDLPDAPGTGKRKSARQKFEDRKKRWPDRIPGAERVRIELWSAGDLLQRLVVHRNQGGIVKFFWDKEVFSTDWCARRMEKTAREAGGRYSPELHIDLPVAFALEGLAQSDAYWEKFRSRRGAVLKAASHLTVSRYEGLGVTRKLQRLGKLLAEWELDVPSCVKPPDRLERTRLLEKTRAFQEVALEAFPHEPVTVQGNLEIGDEGTELRRSSLRHYLHELENALDGFENLLQSSAAGAACQGALLLTGKAGQGKTHLFCDAAQRAIDAGRPAILILGGQLSGRNVLSEVAERLGLGQVASEALIGAMKAAGEASNAPFLLLIDALNEAENPRAWQNELPLLLAEIAQHPWISIGVSVRSTYQDIVLPVGGLSDLAEVEHQGFAGREVEAAERFFSEFGLEHPEIPLLGPEFTNPLFLKLYCEGLKGMGLSAPSRGETHVADVFEHYLKSKADRIASQLELDPVGRPVQGAIDAFCNALADSNRDRLPRSRATEIINGFAPGRDQWPGTMLGALLNESVLTADVEWDSDSEEDVDVIRFTYQRFADYRIGSALLAPFDGKPERFGKALAEGEPLSNQLLQAPAGWIEALSVQVPEHFGVELLDAAQWDLGSFRRKQWEEAFVRSIGSRRPSAVTVRSRELLREVQDSSPESFKLLLETVLSVAPSPEHPLNAVFLHEWLKSMPMPDRDVAWSIPTYFAFNSRKTLDRLIHWAAQGPYPGCRNEVVELAAVPIVWTFTSPNRRMRDYATKALSRLLSGHLSVLPSLIRRFDGVDDPYVIERLAVVSHGAVLCGGSEAKNEAVTIAEELKRVALAEAQVPNIITRDAVRGIYEWFARHELVDCNSYQEVLPPYGSAPPEVSRTKEQLEREYREVRRNDSEYRRPYGELFMSIFDMGDFGKYVIQPKLESFSRYPLSSPRPKIDNNPTRDPWTEVPEEIAQRWVFERVLSLGWTPEKFAEFDHHRLRPEVSRSEHKPERFGKKYQWIALRELIARIADNFHMTADYNSQAEIYAGPWQFFGRDIDPTLPPPPRVRNEDDVFEVTPTFSNDETWWKPPGPSYHRDEPPVGEGWASESDDIPEFEPLIRRKGEDGTHWVVLRAHYQWDDEVPEDQKADSRPRRQLWSQIYGWLVQPADQKALVDYLAKRTLMRRWMPEGREHTDAAYLGELPWAASTDECPDTWEEVREHGFQPTTIKVYPAWAEYLWEGNVLDCSIDEAASAWLPAPILFEEGALTWVPGTRVWKTPAGVSVARCFEEGHHTALLVREDWLKRTLRKTDLRMVFGWLGEKQLISRGHDMPGDWMRIDAVASFAGSNWSLGERRLKRCSPGK